MKELSKEMRDVIDSLVEAIYANQRLNINEPIDVKELAQNLGFSLAYIKPNIKDIKGIVLINPEVSSLEGYSTNKVIGINKTLSKSQNNSIIAHEIGHYFLHSEQGKKYFAHKWVDNEKEKNESEELEANYFGAALLLPKKPFIEKYHKFEKDNNLKNFVETMSLSYNVSKECVEKRIQELELKSI